MSAMVTVSLSDQEWRTKCEELAKAELRRKSKRDQLAVEKEEWSERKKDLDQQIDSLSDICEKLAQEVDSRTGEVPAQQELPVTKGE